MIKLIQHTATSSVSKKALKTKASKARPQKSAPLSASRNGNNSQNHNGLGAQSVSSSVPVTTSGQKTKPQRPASPPTLPPPVITYFNQDAQKWLRTGETVYVTMQGTAGGQATFRIGMLSGNVAMREQSPGQYLGSWVVPAGKNLSTAPFIVTGELRARDKTAEPIPASRPIQIDALLPIIANPGPQETTSATPSLTADLSDEGSGIDIASIHLRVNGRDVTGSAQITAEHIMYMPMQALAAGEQTVELQVSDRAGNKTTQTWHFTVKP